MCLGGEGSDFQPRLVQMKREALSKMVSNARTVAAGHRSSEGLCVTACVTCSRKPALLPTQGDGQGKGSAALSPHPG